MDLKTVFLLLFYYVNVCSHLNLVYTAKAPFFLSNSYLFVKFVYRVLHCCLALRQGCIKLEASWIKRKQPAHYQGAVRKYSAF